MHFHIAYIQWFSSTRFLFIFLTRAIHTSIYLKCLSTNIHAYTTRTQIHMSENRERERSQLIQAFMNGNNDDAPSHDNLKYW